ncbi:Protodermal factor 1, partial [Linum grandiflorum]
LQLFLHFLPFLYFFYKTQNTPFRHFTHHPKPSISLKLSHPTMPTLMLVLLVAAALFSHDLAAATSPLIGEQKNYYPPDPSHSGTPPTPPSGSHTPSTPSHGGHSPPHHNPPSHGGGGYHPTPSNPPSGNCGTPPSVPTPSTPTPTPYVPTPSTPSTPTTPSVPTPIDPSTPPPSGGGGGYYPSPSTPPSGGGGILPPPSPIIGGTPPSIPSSPPFVIDPNSPFSCNYWRSHPAIIWGVLGWWGTLGSAFGVPTVPGFGASTSLPQALSNTRNDGYGHLYREGTAALLNSMVSRRFAFTTNQVRESFVSALASNKAAAAQGHVFQMANEGRLKPRN